MPKMTVTQQPSTTVLQACLCRSPHRASGPAMGCWVLLHVGHPSSLSRWPVNWALKHGMGAQAHSMHAIGPSEAPLPCKGDEMASQPSRLKGSGPNEEAPSESRELRFPAKCFRLLPWVRGFNCSRAQDCAGSMPNRRNG